MSCFNTPVGLKNGEIIESLYSNMQNAVIIVKLRMRTLAGYPLAKGSTPLRTRV